MDKNNFNGDESIRNEDELTENEIEEAVETTLLTGEAPDNSFESADNAEDDGSKEAEEDEEAEEAEEDEEDEEDEETEEGEEDEEDEETEEGEEDEAKPIPAKGTNSGKLLAVIIALALVAAVAIAATILLTPQKEDSDKDIKTENKTDSDTAEYANFDYSAGIDENGFWEGIDASDYITLCDYDPIMIPVKDATVSDDDVNTQIESFRSQYTETKKITDRAVKDGDTLNIDYVGTIDNVEFEGGNTNGKGTDVTIGKTTYIDDFLEQLIGHTPGETFDVNVTFPEDYEEVEEGQTSKLNGKDAVFSVTVNYISESYLPEFNDDFVAKNLTADYGWATADEAKEGIKKTLTENAYYNYINSYLLENCTISDYPESMYDYQKNALLAYYSQYASSYNYTMEDMLTAMGYDNINAFVEANDDAIKSNIKRDLITQAIAKEQGIKVDDDYIEQFFKEEYGLDDYSQFENTYGHNYIVYATIGETVYKSLIQNAEIDYSAPEDTTETTEATDTTDTSANN